jgi:chromosome partitioning protein
MRTSVVPSRGVQSPPHVVVIGNQKGGSGKSTFAMYIIVALLKAGKRVASFDLDLNQLTLTRYLGNRCEWNREHEQKLELPDHYPVREEVAHGSAWSRGTDLRHFISQFKKTGRAHKDDLVDSSALSHSADLRQFMSQLKEIGRAHKHDFIVIDTPGGIQHLSLIAHGMADTLITPINDSFFDLDVLVAMERSDLKPQPSVYAKTVQRALDARRKVSGRATDWIVVRNRLESVESSNARQITQVLDVIQRTLGLRIARGLLERPEYREFFAAGLTVFDSVEGFQSTAETNRSILLARLEVQHLIREIGLIEDYADLEDETFDEIEHLSRLCELALASNPGPPDQGLPMAGPPPPTAPTAAPDSQPSVPANAPADSGAPPLASDALASPLRAAEAPTIDSSEPGSSQSVGPSLVPDTGEAIHECRISFYARQAEQADVASAAPHRRSKGICRDEIRTIKRAKG